METITVYVKGTPIRYNVDHSQVGIYKSDKHTYVPGEIADTCLGKLQCDEIKTSKAGYVVYCSVAKYSRH